MCSARPRTTAKTGPRHRQRLCVLADLTARFLNGDIRPDAPLRTVIIWAEKRRYLTDVRLPVRGTQSTKDEGSDAAIRGRSIRRCLGVELPESLVNVGAGDEGPFPRAGGKKAGRLSAHNKSKPSAKDRRPVVQRAVVGCLAGERSPDRARGRSSHGERTAWVGGRRA